MANRYRSELLIIGLLICTAGCDPHFEPFEDNEEYVFSIQGALDATSDTQFVRVSPIRQVFRQDSEPIDAVVTLKHLETGDTVVMEDSLFQYADDAWAWNFYTDMPIIHGDSYELVAMRSDGRFSRATAQIPEALPEPRINYHCEVVEAIDVLGFIDFFFSNPERFLIADIMYDYRISQTMDILQYPVSFLHNNLTAPEPDGKRLWISWYDNRVEMSDEVDRYWRSVIIEGAVARFVAVGPEWPDYEGLDLNEATLPEANSNIEHGLGALAGMTRIENVVLDHDFFCPQSTDN